MDGLIVWMDLMKVCPPVPSYLFAQMISLLVLMARNVFMNQNDVMKALIVKIIQMNLSPFAPLHVQLICLLVLMAHDVFPSLEFVMDFRIKVAKIFQTTYPLYVTNAKLIICSGVRCGVLIFV